MYAGLGACAGTLVPKIRQEKILIKEMQVRESASRDDDALGANEKLANMVIEVASAMHEYAGSSFKSYENILEIDRPSGTLRVNLSSFRHNSKREGSADILVNAKQWLLNAHYANFAPIHDFDQVQDKLIPIIRSRMSVSTGPRPFVDESHVRPLSRMLPKGGDAVVVLSIDLGRTVMHVNGEMLSQWNKTFDECMPIAIGNLERMSPRRFVRVMPGVYAGSWGDGLEPSRILLPNLVRKMADFSNSVIMIPVENEMLIARANDERGLLNMLGAAEKMMSGACRPVSSKMYRYLNGIATEFVPVYRSVAKASASLERIWDRQSYLSSFM